MHTIVNLEYHIIYTLILSFGFLDTMLKILILASTLANLNYC